MGRIACLLVEPRRQRTRASASVATEARERTDALVLGHPGHRGSAPDQYSSEDPLESFMNRKVVKTVLQ